jgi:PAS domain-containing protein
MRQWELFGITDSEPTWAPPRHREHVRVDDPSSVSVQRSVFFWSTDQTLRLRTVSEAAAQALGRSADWCEGRDLVDMFSDVGPDLAAIEAHAQALSGEEATFTLRGVRGAVRCLVSPMHDGDGGVIGTFCLAAPEPTFTLEEGALSISAA